MKLLLLWYEAAAFPSVKLLLFLPSSRLQAWRASMSARGRGRPSPLSTACASRKALDAASSRPRSHWLLPMCDRSRPTSWCLAPCARSQDARPMLSFASYPPRIVDLDDRPVVGQVRLERPARPARRRVREEEGAQLGGGKGARACRKVPRKLTDGAAAARRARGARAVGVGRGEDGLGVLLRREGRLPAARGAVTRRSLHEWRLSLSAVHGRAPPPAADRGEPRASGGGATRRGLRQQWS